MICWGRQHVVYVWFWATSIHFPFFRNHALRSLSCLDLLRKRAGDWVKLSFSPWPQELSQEEYEMACKPAKKNLAFSSRAGLGVRPRVAAAFLSSQGEALCEHEANMESRVCGERERETDRERLVLRRWSKPLTQPGADTAICVLFCLISRPSV